MSDENKNKLDYQREWRQKNKDYQKKYAANNKDKILEQRKKRYEENKDKIAAYNKKWREDHKEQEIKRRKAYRERNGDKIRQQLRESRKSNPEAHTLYAIKQRAKRENIPFNLTIEDVKAPEFCPVLNIKLWRNLGSERTGPTANSPSVDRIVPELGYIKGNVIVISHLANAIKQNATPEQIRKVADFYDKLINKDE